MKLKKASTKVILLLALCVLFSLNVNAQYQVPQLIHFQAIARNPSTGKPLSNQYVNVRLYILDSTASGASSIIYGESQIPLTDSFGYFDIQLHDSINTAVSWQGFSSYKLFTQIPWYTGHKWLEIDYNPGSTNEWIVIGKVQLITVPYAMVAQTALNVQGFNLNVSNPSDGDILKYQASTETWIPGPASSGGTTYSGGTDISINSNNQISADNTSADWNANKLEGTSISSTSPTSGQVLQYSNNEWQPSTPLSPASYTAGNGISIDANNKISATTGTDFAMYADSESSSGGDSKSGSWYARTLNSVVAQQGSSISLATNNTTITLTAGTYYIDATVPLYGSAQFQTQFYNTDGNGSVALFGSSEYNSTTYQYTQTCSFIKGVVKITSTKHFQIQYYASATNAGEGLGLGANTGNSHNVYTQIFIQKLSN